MTKAPDYLELELYLSRSDGSPLTPDDVAAISKKWDELAAFCEARGLLLNGSMTSRHDTEGGSAEGVSSP